ncbi:5'-methylthioadenosine/S-adenosylhomocysteine nucleosidase [Nocardia cyriacigeorgica]|uniref:5'-methylthioadenosine/S-adenosylhomocysteine nucleosidase family protein n=1 Tax=Nocardia cyriacigeorgica TaxID=135487 RepID=UPI002455C629|nr:5'-methylthioadenosine/S-adenosylhomocysteine nucleosidase [Nocardia cyriacigeorgica]
MTALDLEGAAVRAHLGGLRTHHHPAGTVFEVGHLAVLPQCSVALAVIGMGTANAAAITERAIAEFQPTAVLFVGIAGGLRNWIALGDVVVATRVYAFHGGRVDQDEFLARPRAWDTSHRLVQLAKHVNRSKSWPEAAETTAAVHFEPVAAGDIALNSSTGPESELLHSHYNDAVAIEMESAGVALAGQLHDSTPTIAVRGICDHADGAKQDADNAGWQPIAARNAASFAVGLAAAIDHTQKPASTEQPRQNTGQQPAIPAPPPPPGPTPANHVTAHHRGTSTGNITAGGSVEMRDVDIAGGDIDKSKRTNVRIGGLIAAGVALLLAGTTGVVIAVNRDDTSSASAAYGVSAQAEAGGGSQSGSDGGGSGEDAPAMTLADEFSYSNDDGYRYQTSFSVDIYQPWKDISNSPPGEAAFNFNASGEITITNMLTDRNAPSSPRPGEIYAWWPVSSPICQLGLFQPASIAVAGNEEQPGYCGGIIAEERSFHMSSIGPGESITLDVSMGIGFRSYIDEADFDALAQAFANPASWGWLSFGGGGECSTGLSSLIWVHDSAVVDKGTCDVR